MLPDELKLVFASVVAFLVTEGLKVVGKWLGADLSGAGSAIAASLTTAALVFADSLLALIPAEYHSIVSAIAALVLALLGAFGVHAQTKKFAALG